MYNFVQLPNDSKDKSQDLKDREDSLCITEENRFQNEINPIKLADLGWVDDYKLERLLRQQIKAVADGRFDPDQYFCNDPDDVESAFMWFDVTRREFEENILKRKSSAGIHGTFANQSIIEFGGGTNFKLQTSGTMLNFENTRQLSLIIGQGDLNGITSDLPMQSSSSSDDEEGDEAEKFKKTFLNKKGFFQFQSQRQDNLLIR